MSHPHHIVLAGSGGSGSLLPGLSIAQHLIARMPGIQVTFVGSGRVPDRHNVRAAGFEHISIPSQPAPENVLRAVRFVTDNVAGYWASRWLLRERNVSLVIGLGGYASAATVRAAMARRIPTLLLEQNVVPGRTTRWLAPSATAVCAGFAETQPYFGAKVALHITGNPVRPALEQLVRQANGESPSYVRSTERWGRVRIVQRRSDANLTASALQPDGATREPRRPSAEAARPRRLLVIGGAGGARTLNHHMPQALARLAQRGGASGWQIVHQSGEGQLQETVERYRISGVDAMVMSCIDEMAAVMFHSDLVVCRALGTTLAEIAMAGVPAVVVPHPNSPEGFQLANAEVFAARGGAVVIDELELTDSLTHALATAIEPLLADDRRRSEMGEQIRRLARPNASMEIAAIAHSMLCASPKQIAA